MADRNSVDSPDGSLVTGCVSGVVVTACVSGVVLTERASSLSSSPHPPRIVNAIPAAITVRSIAMLNFGNTKLFCTKKNQASLAHGPDVPTVAGALSRDDKCGACRIPGQVATAAGAATG